MNEVLLTKISEDKHNFGPNIFSDEDLEHAIKTIREELSKLSLEETTHGQNCFSIPMCAMQNLLDYYKYYHKGE